MNIDFIDSLISIGEIFVRFIGIIYFYWCETTLYTVWSCDAHK